MVYISIFKFYLYYVNYTYICLIYSRHHIMQTVYSLFSQLFSFDQIKKYFNKERGFRTIFFILSAICYNPTQSEKGHEGWKSSNAHVGLTSSDQYFFFHSSASYYQYDFLNQRGKDTLTAKEVATMLAAFLLGPQGQLLSSRWNTRHSCISLDPCSQGSTSLVEGGIQGRHFRRNIISLVKSPRILSYIVLL